MHQDFKELLSAFNEGHVKYLIVGGYAVSFHAEPRATKDLDILVSADAENAKAVYAALAKFGAPVEGLAAKDFTDLDSLFRMGTPPVMVDIMPRISGVEFAEAWERRVDVAIDETLTAPFISRDDLLAAKIAAGREQDLADVDALRRSAPRREIEQPQLRTDSSPSLDRARKARAKGLEEWLKLRQRQQVEGRDLTIEEMQANGREDRLKYREQHIENSRDVPDHIVENDRTLESDHEESTRNVRGEIDDDLVK
jgi:hypothetical protein